MQADSIRNLLDELLAGTITKDDVLERLKVLPYEDIGFAKIDHHRMLRQGFPEVVFCEGKTPRQVTEIMLRLSRFNNNVLATRANEVIYQAVKEAIPNAYYYDYAKIITVEQEKIDVDESRYILVLTAGTSDIPVAEEAAVTAEIMGNKVQRIYDVGVAGIHRLLDHQPIIQRANVIIVVAGMEGALASVVGGMVTKPVISVPTSIGYGASFGGVAALLSMLNSCAAGIAVVNIDNGFGAGRLASIINHMR